MDRDTPVRDMAISVKDDVVKADCVKDVVDEFVGLGMTHNEEEKGKSEQEPEKCAIRKIAGDELHF